MMKFEFKNSFIGVIRLKEISTRGAYLSAIYENKDILPIKPPQIEGGRRTKIFVRGHIFMYKPECNKLFF